MHLNSTHRNNYYLVSSRVNNLSGDSKAMERGLVGRDGDGLKVLVIDVLKVNRL